MSDMNLYVATIWLSGALAGFSVSCLLTVLGLKIGWISIREKRQ